MKKLSLIFALCLVALLTAAPAFADEVTFLGSTTGRFYGSGGFLSTTTSTGGIVFNGSTFAGTTSGGLLGFADLGSFTIPTTINPPDGGMFELQVNFTAPAGVSGNPATVGGTFFAFILPNTQGGFNVSFFTWADDDNPVPVTELIHCFTFTNPGAAGSF